VAVAWKSSAWADASEENGTIVLRVCGELDMASRDAIEWALIAAVTSAPAVTVDLRDLVICDSRGLAMFLTVKEKADAQGTDLLVRGLRPEIRRLFEISGVDRIVTLSD
jgi:anti-sigma B factor antagonist